MPLEDLLDPDPDDPRLFRSCAGGVQGRSFSTLASVCTYWEEMHVVQKRHPTTCILGLADDTVGDDEPLADHHLPKRLHTQFDGVVVSTAMQKSILVAVTRTRLNRKYNKRQRYTRKFMAHDEGETCALGDRVRIQMSRPISKHKKYKYVMTLAKAEQL